ncbi:MAG TPA: phosphate ABC transporter permease subunit PstC [Egibacteraceae bacterium]|jgi:phosphate transport system permease protein|nr:phosphate ABC transporter permease subunit PstC [Egibacteraceae bacterium]
MADPARSLRVHDRGRLADPLFKGAVTACGASVLVILGLMIARTTSDAWPIFRSEGLGFFLGTQWSAGFSRTAITGEYGAFPFIYGTLVTAAIAITIALPLAVAVALYITQLAPRRLRNPLSYAVEILAAVPSVVYGLWGLLFFLPVVLRPVMNVLADRLGGFFLFEGPVFGVSYFAAGVVLAIMILPIITAITREVVAVNPTDAQHAAYGLGATRWEVIRRVVLPGSFSGVVGATMLGLGRALGETIAAAMLVGGSQRFGSSLLFAGDTMAAHIANTFQDASPETVLALLAMGVALFLVTTVVNVAARVLVWRIGRVTGDAAA